VLHDVGLRRSACAEQQGDIRAAAAELERTAPVRT
jgi:hypothetical protein